MRNPVFKDFHSLLLDMTELEERFLHLEHLDEQRRDVLTTNEQQPAFLYILRSLIPFLPGGDFPPSVDILHMYPCIEHRYVPLLELICLPL